MKILGLLLAFAGGVGASAQGIVGMPAASAKGHVSYVAELADVPAGKPAVVELRFRVDEGFHVNSHKPSSELLVPTGLSTLAASGAGVKVVREEYPRGSLFRLGVGDGETLDVYQGEFRVRVTVVAAKGESTLTGTLKYQACDNRACFPPRTVAVSVPVRGR